GSDRWEVRTYAARAAAVVGARPVLLRLAADQDHNVEEAAIAGLAATAGPEADSVYIRALGSSGHQVALAAAQAPNGSAHPAEPLAAIFLDPDVRLRVTMAPSSGGGSFGVRLFPGEAPATVARVLRLAREGFYDGKVFQRVEPNFVIQGGGPDANEYVGDVAF